MKIIAIIPTKEGSERVPMKAVIRFNDKPIIQYPIQAILESKIFDRVVVSTDSIEIAKKSGHSDIIFNERSEKDETLSEYIYRVLNIINEEYDYAFICYPFSAMLTKKDILNSYDLAKKYKYNIVPICKYDRPIQRAIHIKGRFCKFKTPRFSQKFSQDLEEFYYDPGQFYWVNLKRFIKTKLIIDKKNIPYLMDDNYCQDVDTFSDLLKLKNKYNNRAISNSIQNNN